MAVLKIPFTKVKGILNHISASQRVFTLGFMALYISRMASMGITRP